MAVPKAFLAALVVGLSWTLLVGCAGSPANKVVADSIRTPTVTISTTTSRELLERFMLARIQRQDPVVLELMTDALRKDVLKGVLSRVPVLQVSNPCWYRHEIAALDLPTATSVVSRVRVYQHFWGGDAAGGPPTSWEQEVYLIKTDVDWKVDRLGPLEAERQEPDEPRWGAAQSACNKPQ